MWRFKIQLLLLWLAISAGIAYAQAQVVTGLVQDAATKEPIHLAVVRNADAGNFATSSREGIFTLQAKRGNILAVSAEGYYPDTVLLTPERLSDGRLVFLLRPISSNLEEVTVYGRLSKYQADSISRRKEFQKIAGRRLPAVGRANNEGFGIGINLDIFDKKEKRTRNAYRLFEILEQDAYINYRWNRELVQRYAGTLEEAAFDRFYEWARPLNNWLRSHEKEEDLVYYINDKLKAFKP